MARPRTPTAVLDAKGSFIKHPERERAASSILEGARELGDPPIRLSPELKELWNEIKGYLAPGVAKISDAPAFEALIRLIASDRIGLLATPDRGQMIVLLSRFGMTPSDRSKVAVEEPKQSPLAKFLEKAKAGNQKPC